MTSVFQRAGGASLLFAALTLLSRSATAQSAVPNSLTESPLASAPKSSTAKAVPAKAAKTAVKRASNRRVPVRFRRAAPRRRAVVLSRAASEQAWREAWRRQWAKQHPQTAKVQTAKAQPVKAKTPKTPAQSPATPPAIKATSAPQTTPPTPAPTAKPSAVVVTPQNVSKPAAPPLVAAPTVAAKSLTPPTTAPANQPESAAPAKPTATPPASATPAKPAETLTRPDPVAAPDSAPPPHTQDSPLAAVGDGWKMIAYLAPVLLVLVGVLKLIRRYQERTGRLPGPLQSAAQSRPLRNNREAPQTPRGRKTSFLESLSHLNAPKPQRGGAIRVVESIPVGAATLHLIEARGKILLLGATASGVSLLSEFEEPAGLEAGDFRALLRAAASDLDGLDLCETELPATALVGALDDAMRETGESLQRRARRLRTVQETEHDFE